MPQKACSRFRDRYIVSTLPVASVAIYNLWNYITKRPLVQFLSRQFLLILSVSVIIRSMDDQTKRKNIIILFYSHLSPFFKLNLLYNYYSNQIKQNRYLFISISISILFYYLILHSKNKIRKGTTLFFF